VNEFLQRLRQRKLVQWGVAYVAAAFALLQGIDIVAQQFGWPEGVRRGLTLTLVVGFFVALVLAWYHGERGAQRVTGTELLILALLLALGGGFLWRFASVSRKPAPMSAGPATESKSPAPPTAIPEKSIAVLPFENLSSDKENAFFTDGVQDEILTDLAKVADLKVTSRTSVMQYREAAGRNLRKIGEELGVAHVLEGSVQRASGKVRVNAQLIDARTDAHLWAQTYDRDLADVFAIQSEIAQTIAGQLQARLSPNEQKAINQLPTTDLEAHDLYLRAWALDDLFNDPNGREYLLQAAQLLDEAVQRDPKFLLAYCLLVEVHTDLYWGGFDHTPARLELARAALEKAERIQPDAGEVHMAKGMFAYHGHRDYDGARAEFALARQTLPNSSHLASNSAAVDRRQGRWDDAFKNYARAIELDPLDSATLEEAGFTYNRTRRFAEAKPYLERAAAANPNDIFVRLVLWSLPYFERGDTGSIRSQLDELLRTNPADAPRLAAFYVEVALAERNRAAAEQALRLIPAEGSVDTTLNALWPRDWFVGLVAKSFGNASGAEKAFAAARPNAARVTQDQPDYAPGWLILGLLDAGLGHKSDAIAEGKRARELLPISIDALDGPIYATYLAMIYAWVGEKDLALEELKLSASTPGGVQYGSLKLSPNWDSLRGDQRFEKIVTSLAPKPAAAPQPSG
jgi:TolB-like protein/Tfp pilus assembly protein PilF